MPDCLLYILCKQSSWRDYCSVGRPVVCQIPPPHTLTLITRPFSIAWEAQWCSGLELLLHCKTDVGSGFLFGVSMSSPCLRGFPKLG